MGSGFTPSDNNWPISAKNKQQHANYAKDIWNVMRLGGPARLFLGEYNTGHLPDWVRAGSVPWDGNGPIRIFPSGFKAVTEQF